MSQGEASQAISPTLAGQSLALPLAQKPRLTMTSCHPTPCPAGIPAGLSVPMQIWAGLLLDRDVFKVKKSKRGWESSSVPPAAAQEQHLPAGG